MWKHLIIMSLGCGIAPGNLLAAGETEAIQLILNHKPDIDCDGIPEKAERVAPGACIIYEIQALNTDDKVYRNILISARIPEHGILVQPYTVINDSPPVDSIINQDSNGIRLMNTNLETLRPGSDNKITLRYSVRVL